MTRYVVVEVGCLECSFDGDAEATVLSTHESLTAAKGVADETLARSDRDRFVLDLQTLAIHNVHDTPSQKDAEVAGQVT